MIDLLQAAQTALFAALKPIEQIDGLPAGIGVYQHLPENTQPPFVMIGMMSSESEDEHGEQFELITAEVMSVFRGAGRAPLLAMMHAVRASFDNQLLEAPGISFERPRFVRAEAGEAIADGVTYVGLSTFEFHAELEEGL